MKKKIKRKIKARKTRRIRYGVIGLGHIAQTAVLPAFKNAKKNSELAALISSDPQKLKKLARKWGVEKTYPTESLEDCFREGAIDALYIATPNTDHLPYIRLAAKYGVDVLCEKPLAETAAAAQEIREIVAESGIKLMVAYRLHFDPANLKVIEKIKQKKIGEPKIFSSVFSYFLPGEGRR
jgi:predicted dehydrogenase